MLEVVAKAASGRKRGGRQYKKKVRSRVIASDGCMKV